MIKNQKAELRAVLTGDIVNSTSMKPEVEKTLLEALGQVLLPYEKEFYRGDSFQAYIPDTEQALQIALSCRVAAISLSGVEESAVPLDIRISIGIGTVQMPVGPLGTAKGEAFLLSGRALDEMQTTDRRLTMITTNPIANIALEVMADHLDEIVGGMTAKQAEVISGLLQGITQQEVASTLDKSKSTVSQLVNAGKWPIIDRLLTQYRKLIPEII